jgi:F-type H+-transporting ATPase subunit gamma
MSKARDIRRRIRSIQSTRQITHTMEMVAASKLRRAQDRVRAARPYAAKLAEVISGLFAPELAEKYPILRQPEKVRRSALVLITSNRGLAGGFNVNLIRKARGVLGELRDDGVDVEFHVIGRKGISYFQFRREPMASRRLDITDRPSVEDGRSIIDPLIPRFESGELDAIDIVYSHFQNALSTPPTRMRVLPISPPDDSRRAPAYNYLFEPSAEEILTFVLPLYVRNAIYRALVESAASEQGARMTAMKNATENADDMIKTLTLQYNKARQAQITQELTEITGGAEAVRG